MDLIPASQNNRLPSYYLILELHLNTWTLGLKPGKNYGNGTGEKGVCSPVFTVPCAIQPLYKDTFPSSGGLMCEERKQGGRQQCVEYGERLCSTAAGSVSRLESIREKTGDG